MRAVLKGHKRLGNFMISAFLPDFTICLPSTSPPQPDRQGLYSQMAIFELEALEKLRMAPVGEHVGRTTSCALRAVQSQPSSARNTQRVFLSPGSRRCPYTRATLEFDAMCDCVRGVLRIWHGLRKLSRQAECHLDIRGAARYFQCY